MNYVHGYSATEGTRLADQASALTELLHGDTAYPAGSSVLEAGCGTGAQTVILAGNSPAASVMSIDLSAASLALARRQVRESGRASVAFGQADVFMLPFRRQCFDHVFVCFVLEHLADPAGALRQLRTVLRPGGTMTVIEGDHGSAFFHPDSADARRVIGCLVDLQRQAGGDSLIGRRLRPLLDQAGFRDVSVSPRTVHAHGGAPELADGFTRRTFTAMVEGVRAQAIGQGLIDEAGWAAGIRDLQRTAEDDGTFSYTFFKAVAAA
jgi:SAM-dependent methyltransferase